MPKLDPLLVVIFCIALLGASCVTAVCWGGKALGNEGAAHASSNSQWCHLTKMSVASQTKTSRETESRSGTTSGLRLLELQSVAPSSTSRANTVLTPHNATRIIVPIKAAKNASGASAQTSNGFAFPAWLWIWGPILILSVILIFLLLQLIRGSNGEPAADDTRRPPAPQFPAKADESQSRRIPIEGADTKREAKGESLSGAKDQKITNIPIDAPDEPKEEEQ
jgi:hypothetical protein